jgi:hypothetical protein
VQIARRAKRFGPLLRGSPSSSLLPCVENLAGVPPPWSPRRKTKGEQVEAVTAAEDMGGMREAFGSFRSAMHDMQADMRTELSGLRGDGVGHPIGLTCSDCFSSGP